MDYTPEQTADFNERAKAFAEEYKELYQSLKDKHECELKYGISTVPSPSGVFGLAVNEQIGDLKYAAKPSPFVPTDDGGVAEAS